MADSVNIPERETCGMTVFCRSVVNASIRRIPHWPHPMPITRYPRKNGECFAHFAPEPIVVLRMDLKADGDRQLIQNTHLFVLLIGCE